MMKRFLTILLCLMLLCCIALAEEDVPSAQLTLKEPSILLHLGKTTQLKTTTSGLKGKITYTYASDDDAVVSVNKKGIVTGLSQGTAHVTIHAVDRHGTEAETVAEIRVIIPIRKMEADAGERSLQLAAGTSYRLNVSITPEDASIQQLTWSSDKEDVATVDDQGLIAAVGPGSCRITAATNDGTAKKLVVNVQVKKYDLLILTPEGLDVTIETQPSSVSNKVTVGGVTLSRATDIEVRFETGCAASDREGHLIGVKPGADKITINITLNKDNKRTFSQRSFSIYVAPEAVPAQAAADGDAAE